MSLGRATAVQAQASPRRAIGSMYWRATDPKHASPRELLRVRHAHARGGALQAGGSDREREYEGGELGTHGGKASSGGRAKSPDAIATGNEGFAEQPLVIANTP